MLVFHWWFVAVPVWIWHRITPLSFGSLIGGVLLYFLYAAATAIAVILSGYVLLGIAAVLKAVGQGFREGFRKSMSR